MLSSIFEIVQIISKSEKIFKKMAFLINLNTFHNTKLIHVASGCIIMRSFLFRLIIMNYFSIKMHWNGNDYTIPQTPATWISNMCYSNLSWECLLENSSFSRDRIFLNRWFCIYGIIIVIFVWIKRTFVSYI